MSTSSVFLIVNLVGGFLVLGGYGFFLITNPETSARLWGDIPEAWKAYFFASMLISAIGYIIFFVYVLVGGGVFVKPVYGLFNIQFITILVSVFLIMAALWIPLTISMLDDPGRPLGILIKIVLWGASLSSIGITLSLLTAHNINPGYHWLAVFGIGYLAFHCTILDAIIWVRYFTWHN